MQAFKFHWFNKDTDCKNTLYVIKKCQNKIVHVIDKRGDVYRLNGWYHWAAPLKGFFSSCFSVSWRKSPKTVKRSYKTEYLSVKFLLDLVCIDSSRLSCLGAAPVFNPSSYSGTVDENVPTDTTVSGITLSASDSDGDNITYSIISSAGPFKLSGDGLSVLTNGLVIDFESQSSYSLTVQAEAAGKHGNGPWRNRNFNFDIEEPEHSQPRSQGPLYTSRKYPGYG